MRTSFVRKTVFLCLIVMLPLLCKAQSTVTEVSWVINGATHQGLLVLYPNNNGFLKIKVYVGGIGWVWVLEDAVFSSQGNVYGSSTFYINCYNPRTTPYVPWAADNFVIYPNGSMFTQDAAGQWSTAIIANPVPVGSWQYKFREYNIR